MQVLLEWLNKGHCGSIFQRSERIAKSQQSTAAVTSRCVMPAASVRSRRLLLPHSTLDAVSVSGLIRDLISGDVCYCSAEDASDITPANCILHSVTQDRVDCATLTDIEETTKI